MDNLLKKVVDRQKTELNQFISRSHVARDQAVILGNSLDSPLIKVISGPRRAGKSTLAIQSLVGKKFGYLSLEDEALPPDSDGDDLIHAINQVYGGVDYYFFDEIQNLDNWEKVLNRLHRRGLNVIVTGSNSHLLGDEFASALTGRHIAIELLPFSYKEYVRCYENSDEQFNRYLIRGGFPEVAMARTDYVPYLTTLWDSIVLKDIVHRKKVRQAVALRDVLSLFLTSMGSRFSYDSLTRSLAGSVSAPTVKNFVQYGIEAYLIAELTPFSVKTKMRMKADRKAYVIDNGFFTTRRVGVMDDLGKLLENLVFVELVRRGYRPGFDLFYYVTSKGNEVDFLLRREHTGVELIQVTYSLGQQKTRIREFRAILEAAEELNIAKLTIVSMTEDMVDSTGGKDINIVSAKRWFLDEKKHP